MDDVIYGWPQRRQKAKIVASYFLPYFKPCWFCCSFDQWYRKFLCVCSLSSSIVAELFFFKKWCKRPTNNDESKERKLILYKSLIWKKIQNSTLIEDPIWLFFAKIIPFHKKLKNITYLFIIPITKSGLSDNIIIVMGFLFR